DKKSFIWLDTPKKQRMFSEKEKPLHGRLSGTFSEWSIIRHSERITRDSEVMWQPKTLPVKLSRRRVRLVSLTWLENDLASRSTSVELIDLS
ncbi:MAG TPA: hypothetical protein VFQ43_22300, partial [Nitrososphaera sp.]|nr:hypothetical protein [Nitrososphaera sp.]